MNLSDTEIAYLSIALENHIQQLRQQDSPAVAKYDAVLRKLDLEAIQRYQMKNRSQA